MPKKSFLVYYDLEEQTETFTDEQLGKLLRAMFAYEKRGEIMKCDDPYVTMAFNFVCVQLREGKERYENRCAINRENGKNGGRPTKNE